MPSPTPESSVTRRRWRRSPAGHEGVTNVSLVTDTHWDVIGNLAVSVDSTQPRTGINAMEISALFA